MKNLNTKWKWTVIKKGNGKFYPRMSSDRCLPYWPREWNESSVFDTLEEAKHVLITRKAEFEAKILENEETVVFEL